MNDQPRRRRRPAVQTDDPPRVDAAPIATIEERRHEIPAEPLRNDMRQDTRQETPREEAEREAARILEREEQAGDFQDKFPLPQGGAPDGWHYEWKKKSVLGWEDRSYAISLASSGWRPVPTERHPEFMPTSGGYLAIERDGLILMEIPEAVVKHRRAAAYNKARDQIEIKRKQMNHAPAGTFERDNKGASLVKINRGYEPLAIPSDKAPAR